MSRVNETRLRNCEAAARLVAADRRERAEAADEQARFLTVQLDAHAARIVEQERQLAAQAAATETAHARIAALEAQLDDTREQGETKLDAQRAAHEQEVVELRTATVMRDQSYQTELDKAMERMEGVQQHMMKQISEARDDQKRAEAQVVKMQQKNEPLLTELSALRAELAEKTRTIEQHKETTEKKDAELIMLQAERENLLGELATVRDKLEVTVPLMASLEARAVAAESRLTQAMATRTQGAKRGKAGRTSK
jgi:chromosome segregation ATPase